MRIQIILANHNKASFCGAIAETCIEVLKENGHKAVFHDLYGEKFQPVLMRGEECRGSKLNGLVKKHCEEIKEADGIIIIHPNWWGMPPAILKGWIDRVIRVDVAYKFLAGDKGEGVPVGLLKAKTVIVFNTSNTGSKREKKTFKDPLETIWKNCVFGLCGIKDFYRKNYGVIVTSTEHMRKTWLQDVKRTVNNKFYKGVRS
jgi:putative NADPH-quinone reductase